MSIDTEAEILAEKQGNILCVTLNRPAALNALSHNMIKLLRAGLAEWSAEGSITTLVFRGAGGKAFCAGGDIKDTWKHREDTARNDLYFYDEYNLIRELFHFPKPTIALMDGITMGGGYGVAGACRYRIATENTKWAMPETGIGFFPDVAAAYYLLQAPGHMGMCMALSGMTIGPEDTLYGGFASHYIYSESIPDFIKAVEGEGIDSALASFHKQPAIMGPVSQHQYVMDECFSAPDITGVMARLTNDPSEWAQGVLAILQQRSPLSLGITYQRMKRAQGQTYDSIAEEDYVIARRFMRGQEFFEGVRAVLVDKDKNPQWQPETLEKLSENEVLSYFEPLSGTLADGFRS